jgi:hypothetical protein
VTNVSPHGFWILLEGQELFLSFADFPWFKTATIAQIVDVELERPGFLRWPQLDVDLHVESILHPDAFPLVSKKAV